MDVFYFRDWLQNKYGKKKHRFNDLLSDAISDRAYPWLEDVGAQMEYLSQKGADADCMETLVAAYRAYMSYLRKEYCG